MKLKNTIWQNGKTVVDFIHFDLIPYIIDQDHADA